MTYPDRHINVFVTKNNPSSSRKASAEHESHAWVGVRWTSISNQTVPLTMCDYEQVTKTLWSMLHEIIPIPQDSRRFTRVEIRNEGRAE